MSKAYSTYTIDEFTVYMVDLKCNNYFQYQILKEQEFYWSGIAKGRDYAEAEVLRQIPQIRVFLKEREDAWLDATKLTGG